MSRQLSWSGLLLLAYSCVALAASYTCTESVIPISITAQTTVLKISPPANQTELSGYTGLMSSLTSNFTTDVVDGKTTLNASYNIWSELCVPAGFKAGGTVELAIHGINFDHSYWNFGGKGSKYNYVEAAIKVGHAVFIYDRLGVGKSSTPDGIKEVQASTQIEVAAALVKYLRSGTHGQSFGKVIGIGHSYGSIQLVGLAEKHGNILDATILTGIAASTSGLPATIAAFDSRIASEQNKARFGNLPSSYFATGGITGDQVTFFLYPYFEYSSLVKAEATKGTVTLGDLITLGEPLSVPAFNYTNPVLVATGDKDYIFCGGNCYQPLGNITNLVEPLHGLFPAVSDFTAVILANTGHGVNLHLSAPQSFNKIVEWAAKIVQ